VVVNDPSAVPSAAAPSGTIPAVDEEDHVRGNPNADVTFIEYSDFECPFCSRFVDTVDQVMAQYGDDIRFVYRHFPLTNHPEAEPAANAAECAGEQGKFWEYHDALFAQQDQLGDALYSSIASDLGINNKQFKDCVSSGKYLSYIRQDEQEGASAGVTGTPGSFVIDADGNATPIQGALPFASVQPIIEAALGN
jgi:protein-disulfide isomerase